MIDGWKLLKGFLKTIKIRLQYNGRDVYILLLYIILYISYIVIIVKTNKRNCIIKIATNMLFKKPWYYHFI